MSRLTASPFHKPSPFEFPRAPLSPPETMSDHVGSAQLPTNVSILGGGGIPVDSHHIEAEAVHRSQSPETAGARFRRVSSLAYHSSGLRESRERAVQRSSKSFVVVIPPTAFLQEHGQLGHTLSSGPRHRLSQGMLMPLFPTMYGQLSAIAREFNFPSTTGICLYLHFTENGFTATPRISDDTWSLIWGNVFDPSAPSQRLPIVGKLEFDLDLRHARWYSAWIASSHREHLDVPASVGPSTAPSIAHFRGDSRTTDLEMILNDEQQDSNSVSPRSANPGRHVPRKLSLVDRLDSSLRAVVKAAQISPEKSASAQALSPIFQEDEPKTARMVDTLEKRVNTWRASASLTPSALAAKGQTSLEPANLPNTIALDDVEDGKGEEELNLEDFAWSVSSFGPNDWEDGSIASWDRLPSVHLAHRMESSVCLTPSDCTSFGPSDYTLPSPVPSMERVLTPDIAHRMYEDCPPTPSTATSWGPPSEFSASPMSFSRASSVDIGDRATFSPPQTPMTATSWGPASEYPPSPMSFGRASSVDIGDRVTFSPPQTPMTATSWGPASWPPTPATPYYVHTPDAGQRSFDPEDIVERAAPWGHVWPYSAPSEAAAAPWGHVWPYGSSPPNAAPWGHVWPYNSSSASTTPWGHAWPYSPSSTNTAPWGHAWPYIASSDSDAAPWRHTWPYSSYGSQRPAPVSVRLPCAYPSLNIYPSVYPHFDLYPAEPSTTEPVAYPEFDLYPAVNSGFKLKAFVNVGVASAYPHFDIYPAVKSASKARKPEIISLGPCGYPDFSIYPPVSSNSCSAVLKISWKYPLLDIYPAVYPHVLPYPSMPYSPAKRTTQTSGYPDFEIYPQVSHKRLPEVQVLKLSWCYPIFDIYPAVYPHVSPYPGKPETQSNVFTSGYPTFDIYPPTSAHAFSLSASQRANSKTEPRPPGDPDFEIYPSIQQSKLSESPRSSGYPHFEIYPPVSRVRRLLKTIGPNWGYPIFDLYPAVYPFVTPYPSRIVSSIKLSPGYPDFEIYPASTAPSLKTKLSFVEGGHMAPFVVRFPWAYPIFDLYPGVYPHIKPYPSTQPSSPQTSVVIASRSREYPDFVLYPCRQYPDFDLYLGLSKEKVDNTVKSVARYPVFDLYPAVYPHILPYPSVVSVAARPSVPVKPLSKKSIPALPKRRRTRSHRALHLEVFPDGLVSTPSGTYPKMRGIVVATTVVTVDRKAHRSHRSLHDEVFPDGVVISPSSRFRPEVPPRPVGGRPRSGSISNRPISVAGALPPPSYGLPPRPNYRLSTVEPAAMSAPAASSHLTRPNPASALPTRSVSLRGESTASRPSSSVSPQQPSTAPLRRAVSSVSSSTRTSSLRGGSPTLAPVAEGTPSTVGRSVSMSRRSVAPPPPHMTTGDESKPMPRKRESLVLQRARAYESSDAVPSRISMATLKEFPLPPPPPPPSIGLPALPTRRTSLNPSRG